MQTYKQLFKAGQATNLPYRGNTFIIQASDQGNSVKVDFVQNGATVYDLQNVGPGLKARPVLGFDGLVITASVDTNLQFIVSDGDIELQITQQTVTVTNPGVPVVNGPTPLHATIDGTVTVSGATLTATNVGINNTSANPVPVSLVSEPGAPVAVTLTGSTDATPIPTQAVPPASAPTDNAPVTVPAYAAWAASTAYALNAYAMNGGNLYQVTTAGTSAASGGPTGTGSAIADGTVTWKYIQTGGGTQILAASASRKAARIGNAGTGKLAITASPQTTFASAAIVLNPGDIWNETDAPAAAWYAISDVGSSANVQVLA